MVLHYQPKVDMSNGALIGTEALIRWQHPQQGLLLPDRFLPAIEGDDLAIELGEWVIEAALRQIELWATQGQRIPVSVNICPRHLQQANFAERLQVLLDRYPAVDPSCLELEILETSTVQDFAHVSGIIEACLAIGIQVSIDDFGMGYSSLSYLKRLPAPILKIDQSFVRNMLEDPDDLALLQGIMGLANAFGRSVVAEGVETAEQGVLLLKLGCAFAQGYGIARPMPADQIIPWYSHWWPDARWTQTGVTANRDWPLLVAQVEARAWGRALERHMSGIQSAPPELDERRCRFGIWLDAEKSGPRSGSAPLRQIDALHHRAHIAARKALDLKQQGAMEDAMSLVRSAVALGQEIDTKLDALTGHDDTAAGRPHRFRLRSRLAPISL
jgi:EAL domain-containing protein (putative c-di-GMP-specific phosphodiesterase class I)